MNANFQFNQSKQAVSLIFWKYSMNIITTACRRYRKQKSDKKAQSIYEEACRLLDSQAAQDFDLEAQALKVPLKANALEDLRK